MCKVYYYIFSLSLLCDMLLDVLTAGMLSGGDNVANHHFLARHASYFSSDLCSLTPDFYIQWQGLGISCPHFCSCTSKIYRQVNSIVKNKPISRVAIKNGRHKFFTQQCPNFISVKQFHSFRLVFEASCLRRSRCVPVRLSLLD